MLSTKLPESIKILNARVLLTYSEVSLMQHYVALVEGVQMLHHQIVIARVEYVGPHV